MAAHEGDTGVAASKKSAFSHISSALDAEGDAVFSEPNSPSLESQLVRQIQIRDSLVLKELAQKAESNFEDRDKSSLPAGAEKTGQSNSTNPKQKSLQDLHSEAFDLSGLEFRSRSMVRIASQRQLIQDVMLTNISGDKQDPLLSRARRLMQERDSRVKDLTNQLRVLNEIRDRVEIIRRQRAALAIENRSLAQRNAWTAQPCAQMGPADHPMADAPADPAAPNPDVLNESGSFTQAGAGLLNEISFETRRHVKIRSIFSSLVRLPELLLNSSCLSSLMFSHAAAAAPLALPHPSCTLEVDSPC
jgi:hypothetical protein